MKVFNVLLESQDQILVLTVLRVPNSLDSCENVTSERTGAVRTRFY